VKILILIIPYLNYPLAVGAKFVGVNQYASTQKYKNGLSFVHRNS
jgi:hypothetical protein